MVEDIVVGDLFGSQAQTLVNTVNCVGVMGKGIALEFKKKFPEMYKDYVKRCKARQVKLGKPYLFPEPRDMGQLSLLPDAEPPEQPWILNFPTKKHWRSKSYLTDIEAGLAHLEQHYRTWGITSLAVPALGCGNGGLPWQAVGPILYRHLNRLHIPVELYAPAGTPPEELARDFLADGARREPTVPLRNERAVKGRSSAARPSHYTRRRRSQRQRGAGLRLSPQ